MAKCCRTVVDHCVVMGTTSNDTFSSPCSPHIEHSVCPSRCGVGKCGRNLSKLSNTLFYLTTLSAWYSEECSCTWTSHRAMLLSVMFYQHEKKLTRGILGYVLLWGSRLLSVYFLTSNTKQHMVAPILHPPPPPFPTLHWLKRLCTPWYNL